MIDLYWIGHSTRLRSNVGHKPPQLLLPKPTVVGSVTATDPDTGDTLSYAITAGDTGSVFAIDSSGQITVADGSQLDFETTTSYSLTVTVTDDGTGTLTDTATVTINVNDLNENPSVGDETFTVDENAANATVVGSVTATDPDTGDTLSYAITAGDSVFAIDSSGQITVADGSQLDFETTTSYSLTVTVTDDGTGTLTDTAIVTINVNDLNENPSVGDETFTVDENAANATGKA